MLDSQIYLYYINTHPPLKPMNCEHMKQTRPVPVSALCISGEVDGKLDPGSTGSSDLVGELLARGNKLREAMIVSTLDSYSRQTSQETANDISYTESLPITPTKPTRYLQLHIIIMV